MKHILDLIQDLKLFKPFKSKKAAEDFLSEYNLDDQCALISALYIGRSHIHDKKIRDDYLLVNIPFDRFYETGTSGKWVIHPSDFARILYEKNDNLDLYYKSFVLCTESSSINIDSF